MHTTPKAWVIRTPYGAAGGERVNRMKYYIIYKKKTHFNNI